MKKKVEYELQASIEKNDQINCYKVYRKYIIVKASCSCCLYRAIGKDVISKFYEI